MEILLRDLLDPALIELGEVETFSDLLCPESDRTLSRDAGMLAHPLAFWWSIPGYGVT